MTMITNAEILFANILIVDDQAAHVQLMEQVLRDEGYTRVSATTSPKKVQALHEKHHYDLILLDLKMPGMDGFEVMEALKVTELDPYLPVIVLTIEHGHKLRALHAGAKDFINKPFDLLECKTRIRNMLEVRLLYKRLESHNRDLEQKVEERTAELSASEARFRSLTELASDWYWEQNDTGDFTTVSGPVFEMLGIRAASFFSAQAEPEDPANPLAQTGWNEEERKQLQAKIAARQPFIDFPFIRTDADGSQRHFRVSGEPMFNRACQFTGYRGIGVEMTRPPGRPTN